MFYKAGIQQLGTKPTEDDKIQGQQKTETNPDFLFNKHHTRTRSDHTVLGNELEWTRAAYDR